MNGDPAASPALEWKALVSDDSYDIRRPRYSTVKVIVESISTLILLVLTGPLVLVLMGLIRLTSYGPALYKQVRLGLNGRPYTIFKLRTMYHDCERLSGPQWSLAGDPRITPLGHILRKTHLDELPQLWNVLRGDMSLVGPRPERPEFVVELERVIPGYGVRLQVRPGITGLAQIQLPPDEDFAGVRRKVAYDSYYVRRVGLWLDFRILLGTCLKILGVSFDTIRRSLALPESDVVYGETTPREYVDGAAPSLLTASS